MSTTPRDRGPRPPADVPRPQRSAHRLAWGFLVVGILGFVPVLTTNVTRLDLAGPYTPAVLLGVLPVTGAGNAVHLLLGLTGLAARSRADWACGWLRWGGAAYAVLCARSLAIWTATRSPAAVGDRAIWVALGLGLVMVALSDTSAPSGGPVRGAGRPAPPPGC